MLVLTLLLAGCTGSGSPPAPVASTAAAPVPAPAQPSAPTSSGQDPALGHEPGVQDLAPQADGDVDISPGEKFRARPNYARFASACRPPAEPNGCYMPLFPQPRMVPGTAGTRDFPYEAYPNRDGDYLLVECQTEGAADALGTISDDRGRDNPKFASNIWNMFVVPKEKLLPGKRGLFTPANDEKTLYYAYGPDIFSGDTSRLPDGTPSLKVHDLSCP